MKFIPTERIKIGDHLTCEGWQAGLEVGTYCVNCKVVQTYGDYFEAEVFLNKTDRYGIRRYRYNETKWLLINGRRVSNLPKDEI